MKYDKIIKDLLTVARGEMILENMIKTIKDFWNKYELELVRYQNKCRLIKGWDDLFAKVDEDLNNLNSMKISPFYKSFEVEILPWDEKLQRTKIIFDMYLYKIIYNVKKYQYFKQLCKLVGLMCKEDGFT